MRRVVSRPSLVAAACVLLLAGCGSSPKAPADDNAPTLASLGSRTVSLDKDRRVASDETQAIAAYRRFLDTAPQAKDAPQRAEAMRRLGDLEMDVADMPYGDRQGGVRDPHGNIWWISQRTVEAPYEP